MNLSYNLSYYFKVFFISLLVVLFLHTVFAEDEGWDGLSKGIVIDINVSGLINISDPSNVDFLEVNLNYFPKETDGQNVMNSSIFPISALKGLSENHFYFFFDSFDSKVIKYGVKSRVQKDIIFSNVSSKVPFPYINISDEYNDFILPTETIDFNEGGIITKAHEIVDEEDDAYLAIVKVAEWVNKNVKYDLTTASAQASLPASWVFKNKEGVCDEITNLFMALLRALGVPVRFVSGVSYTTADYIDNHWSPHGWSEVYIPGSGWVPFDVTYRQYGYVDPTHIVLGHSLDSTDDSTNYRWKESGSTIFINPLDIQTDFVRSVGNLDTILSGTISIFAPNVGMGSYNLVELTLKNERDSYVTHILNIATVDGVEFDSATSKTIVFKPLETKKVYWIVKVSSNLEKGYSYNVPIKVFSQFSEGLQTSFTIYETEKSYGRKDFDEILNIEENLDSDTFNIEFKCNLNTTKQLYVDTHVGVLCKVTNYNNEEIKNMDLCLKENCINLSLEPEKKRSTIFLYKLDKAGANIIPIYLKHDNFTKYKILNVEVNDLPNISIENINYPLRVNFSDLFSIQFTLKRTSHSFPQNIKVVVSHPAFNKNILINKLQSEQELIMQIPASSLEIGENEIALYVTFKDTRGETYISKEEVNITLTNLTFMQKLALKTRFFVRWLQGLFE